MKSTTDPRTARLIAARQQASRNKHAQAQQAVQRLIQKNERISFARVAREAGVSTWLLYNTPELKHAVADAMLEHTHRDTGSSPATDAVASGPSLLTDLELARHEIADLRRTERKLRDRLQRTLGAEIEQIDRSDLIARIAQLEAELAQHKSANVEIAEANTQLTQLVTQQADELATANTLLRRYMKEASRASASSH